MKFKTRLVVAFFTIILIPLVLSSALVCMVGKYQLSSIEKNYGIKNTTVESLASSVTVLTRLTEQPYRELEALIRENPEEMEDAAQLESLNGELQDKKSYLLVRKNDTIAYIGTEASKAEKVISQLPEYGAAETTSENGMYLGGKAQVLLKQIDFQYSDGSEGSAFIVTNVGSLIPEVKNLFVEIIVCIFLVLVFTACVLIIWIYRSVMGPVGKMREATKSIKEGNLDFELPVETDDELGQLCGDLEDMRKRLKNTAEEKLKFDKENKELISNISHDLKTPITAIKGYVEGIMDGVADTPEKMDRYIKTVYNKANDMNVLINELSLYSKIDSNIIPYNFEKININSYFKDCVDEIGADLEQRGMMFSYRNYCAANVMVTADPEQLKRVINNIINNACKYNNKAKGKVGITLTEYDRKVQVAIKDNGIGISKEDLPHIFRRTYRADMSRNSAGGSGLGLSICKKIIEEHGGEIWAESKLRAGTTIFFTLNKVIDQSKEK